MERMMMNMISVICCLAWMKLDRLNVVGILHIMLIVIFIFQLFVINIIYKIRHKQFPFCVYLNARIGQIDRATPWIGIGCHMVISRRSPYGASLQVMGREFQIMAFFASLIPRIGNKISASPPYSLGTPSNSTPQTYLVGSPYLQVWSIFTSIKEVSTSYVSITRHKLCLMLLLWLIQYIVDIEQYQFCHRQQGLPCIIQTKLI